MRFLISTDRSEEIEQLIDRRRRLVSPVTPKVSLESNEHLLDGTFDINFVYLVINHLYSFVTALPKLPVTSLVSNLPNNVV